jgi:4-hydroxymandelate oxidase
VEPRWRDGLEARARELLPEPVFRYLQQGARAGVTTSEAVAAWDALRWVPRVFTDTSTIRTGTTLLGTELTAPLGIAPTTLQRAVHPDGELAVARAAAAEGSLMVVSSNAGTRFADIGATGVAWWVQCYLPQDRTLAEPLLGRASEAGARAVVLTADTPVVGTKYDGGGPTVWQVTDPSLLRVNFGEGYDDDAPAAAKALDIGPGDVAWLRETTGLPVVVKGVLDGPGAVLAAESGAAAVWVSNHGGRQLDRTLATATALPAVAEALDRADSPAELYVDGGIRTGWHVASATALGARACFVGRPPLYALADSGEEGVRRLLAELRTELVETLRLAGCATPEEARGRVVGAPS